VQMSVYFVLRTFTSEPVVYYLVKAQNEEEAIQKVLKDEFRCVPETAKRMFELDEETYVRNWRCYCFAKKVQDVKLKQDVVCLADDSEFGE